MDASELGSLPVVGPAGLTAIRDAPWLRGQADTIPEGREIPGNTGRSGSHASSVRLPQCPRTVPIGPRGPAEHLFRGNLAVLDWGTRPAPLFDIRVAADPTSAPVIRPSSLLSQ